MNKRITYLDTAKGILILLMLIGHIWNEGFVHDFIYVFHMPAFFIISGMVGSRKEISIRGFGKLLLSRIKSLLIPYLFFEIYAILIDIICNGAYLNIKGYTYQILTLQLFNGPLWFLMVMFLSSMIFFFIQGIQSRKMTYAVMLALLLLAMVMPQYQAYISLSTVTLALLFTMVGSLLRTLPVKMSSGGGTHIAAGHYHAHLLCGYRRNAGLSERQQSVVPVGFPGWNGADPGSQPAV